MIARRFQLTTTEAKQISIISYLKSLNFIPHESRKNGNQLWYFSPLHNEKTPSFKVTVSKNSWFDFGTGKGGSIIDFVLQYHGCSLGNAYAILSEFSDKVSDFSDNINEITVTHSTIKTQKKATSVIVDSTKELSNLALIKQVKALSINTAIAKRYLKEVYYRWKVEGKPQFAVGMENDSKGFEVRSLIFKGCLLTKDITTIEGENSKQLSVFEGFYDFLAVLTDKGVSRFKSDVIILHSVSNLIKIAEHLRVKTHDKIFAFMDNDKAGNRALNELRQLHYNVVDMRYMYAGFKDYNDKILNKPIHE